MTTARNIAIWVFIAGAITQNLHAQTVPAEVSMAIQTGNTQSLSEHIAGSLELFILGEESNCTRQEAVQSLGHFFSQYKPNNFIVLHEGGKYAYRYIIGTLKTENGNFRVYYLLKEDNQLPLIQQLRIDHE